MASGGAEEGDGGIPLDIDNVHMLLQVEHDQIQKRTFTNWINAQLAKGCPPSFVSDLFSDLRDGSKLLDLLEVMSGQVMKRQKGHGVFQQRANIETALKFLKKKNVKLVNINIPDIIDGRPSIILGLVWTIILHCHIEELASALSFSSRHSSLDSLSSLDSWSGSPVPASPVPAGRTSPLHRRFRMSAKRVLLMWVRDQCKKVHCSVNVKDFKSSWRSGEVFLAILCSLRPQLVDLSLVQSKSNQENLEEAFHLAEQELHIPRLLEPQDVDVSDPDEKSIMTYVAQFLQYSNDMPAPDDHLQLFPLAQPSFCSPENLPGHFTPAIAVSPLHEVSPSERAQHVTCWLQQADQELSDSWKAAENSSYAEKYQVLQSFAGSFSEQRRPVMTLLATLRRHPELNQQQCALKTAWDHLEGELQRCKADLDLSLPPPLDSVAVWLKHAEAGLAEDGENVKDHADAAKQARTQQDLLKILNKEMSYYVNIVETYHNMDDSGNVVVPPEKFDEIRKRLTSVRVSAKYRGIKLEYQESRHTVLDLLSQISAKVQSWKAPYRSQESMHVLLQDWHETIEHQDLLFILTNALQTLREKANVYTSKAALSENFQLINRQVKEAEREVETVEQAVTATGGIMERVVSAWEMYNKSLASLQAWLAQEKHFQAQSPAAAQNISEWTSCQAQLNEAGNFLIEVTESSTSLGLAEQLSKVNMQWAEYVKKAMFEVSSETRAGASCLQMVHSLTQEASLLLRQPLEVASVPLKAIRQKLQLLSKKMAEVNMSSLSSSPDFQTSHIEKLQKTLPQMLVEAEGACGELQQAASRLEGGLAELDRWSTDALDSYNHQKEKSHRGHSTLEPRAKGLISRGLQLANQVKTEEKDLQGLVARLQKTSPLKHLSISSLKDRITEAVSRCQEILGMFSSLGLKQEVGEFPKNQPPFETIFQTHKPSEMGLLVVARTKHIDDTGSIMLQSQHSNQLSAHTPQRRTRDLQGKVHDEKDIITPNIVTSSPPVTHIHSPLVLTAEEAAESKFLIQPQSFSKVYALASGFSQNDQCLPAMTQTPVRIKCSEIPVLSKHGASSLLQFQTKHKSAAPSSLQSNKPPQPPVMVHSEVHSRAQSMARSRLEKARFRLQGRIQQAMKLFGGKEISESEAKKKQKALKILQPAMLEEFLCAVEGFGAFCSGSQLQDLMLLSDSVRKQWEDVCREMAAFIPILWSEIREGKQPFSVVQCEMHTNAFKKATDQTDRDALQQQAITEGASSIEERAESLRELCETLTPKKSSCLATDQLSESDEVEETQPSDAAIPDDSRRRQPGGDTPLSATDVSANTQPSNNLLQKQSDESPQEDLSSVSYAVPVQPHGDILKLRVQDVPTESEVHLTKKTDSRSEQNPKPSLRAKEQLLKARLLHIAESSQQTQTHTQAVVRSNTVETKQEAEWTIISESAAASQEEHPSEQEVQESYSRFCSAFKSQLQKNKLLLKTFIPDPVFIHDLENQKKHLQTLKQETEALWFNVELQYARFSQFPQLMTKEEGWNEVEREQGQLIQQWREQQVCLQSRMASLENTADLMKSADDQKTLITQKLNQIIGEALDISSLTLADSTLLPDLKEMDNRLQAGMRKLSEKSTEEERQGLEATSSSSLCRGLHNSFHHFEQLRQQLEKVQSAVWALDCFLATVREVKTEIQTVLANQDLSKQKQEADLEQERYSLQAVMQRLQAATEQSDSVDSSLKAVGMTLTMDVTPVTCQDVVKLVTEDVVEMEKQRSKDVILLEKQSIQEHEESKTEEICQTKSGNASPQQQEVQEDPTASEADEESGLEAKRCKLEGENETKTQREEEHKTQTWRLGEDVLETKDQRQRRSSLGKKQGEKKESLVQRRAALLATLRETKKAAEQLSLQEPTLPAVQQRTRALTELESRLADLLSEVQYILGASSQSGTPDQSQTREVEDLWEETSKAVTERLEQCGFLTELLKRFQSIRGELSVTLQRAESTISEHASYMGKDNLQRLYTKVLETKAELTGLGDGIEEVRSVCRQIHTHLRQIPECTFIPFESEADALMDCWLDLSERTDSCLENLHLASTLWDGILQLGTEVERWTSDKVAVFAQCPSFRSEDDIKALQNEIAIQEEHIQHFHQRATEIQTLLQSTESPLELQVVETQMRKKTEELKELISEAEDVYKQMVITKGQITVRMDECFNSLQKIQDSLLTLSGPDVAAVLAKLKELCHQLQYQDEQAESLLEDVHVMASITGPESLQSLSVEGIQLQEKVRNTHQLFSEVQEQTERNIRDLDRLQTENEHLEQWLHAAEEKAAREENLSCLQEEALQQRVRGCKQRVRTELLSQLVSSLQSSNLQQLTVLEDSKKLLERYHNFYTNIPGDSKETQFSLKEEIEVFQALFKSTESWIRDLRQAVDSPLAESPGIQTPLEQKLHCAQAVLSAAFEGEARLEELRVTGDDLCRRVLNEDDLKQEVQETVQRAEEQWRGILQSVEPYYSALKADREITSFYLAQRWEACCKVEELQHQTDQLPRLFPWPGTAERKQAYRLAHQLQEETESLQLTLTSMSKRRNELIEQTSNSIWKDSSWTELDTRWSVLKAELKDLCSQLEEGASNEEHFGQLLQHCYHKLTSLQERMSACQAQKEISAGPNTDAAALEALLQEVTDIEKYLLQLASLKDSIKVSSIAEAQASLTQQVSNIQNHKRALESTIRESLARLKVNRNESIQQVKEEASYVQTALKDLAKSVGNLSGISEALPDISQLKQQWCTIQDCDSRLTELAARAENLQKTRESSSTQETLPADIILTVSAMFGDLGSLRSIFLQKKQDCVENTANRVRETISQLQEWSQRIQAEPSRHSQEALDEGLQLQQALYKVLSEQDFLFNCLGTNVAQKLEKSASAMLIESQSALESLSKHPAIPVHGSVHLENKDLPSRSEQDSLRNESGAPHSVSNEKTLAVGLTASPFSCATDNQENSGSDQNDNKIKTKGTEPPTETSGGSNVEAEATKQDQAGVLKTKDDVLAQIQVECSETPVVLKTQLEPHQLTPQEVNLKSYLGSKDNSGPLYTDSSSQSSIPRTFSENDTGPFVSDSHPNLKKNLIAQEENTPLQSDSTLTSLLKLSVVDADNTKTIHSAHCVTSLIKLPPTKPDNLPITDPESVSEHLEAQLETFEANTNSQAKHGKDTGVTTKKVFTVVLDVDPQLMWQKENAGACSQEAGLFDEKHTKYSYTGFPEMKTGLFITSKSQDMEHCSLAAHQSETSKAVTSMQEKENFCEYVSVDMELHPLDMQKRENAKASSPDTPRQSQEADFSTARPTEYFLQRVFPENKLGLFTTSVSPESDETDLQNPYVSPESNSSVLVNTVLEKVNCVSAKLPCKENHKTHGLKHNEVLKSSKSCCPVGECQLAGAHAAKTTFPDVKPKETTDFCDSGEQTVRTVEDSVESGEALNDTQISATGKKQVTPDNIVCNTDTACEEVPKGENTEEANDFENTECKGSEVPERRDIASLPKGKSERKLPAALEDMGVTQEQPQIPESMEPEKTALGSPADLGSKEVPGGSANSCKHRSTMWEILSEIQNVVERSNIIKRTSHIDLNWYLKSSPGDPEIQLARTVQKILACRYQPAQLRVMAMAKQLEEAEECQHSVQEQVATLKNSSAARVSEPSALKSAEDQWSAALLDASATVQVKAAQLDQVKQYHRQMSITRAFLEVVAAEKGKMSLNSLGSSALQAEKLHVLLQTMEQKKAMMEDLLRLSSQLSVHLSDAESSGALLAQLGDVQEEWRLLKGSLKRALRHASNCTCQSSLLLKEAEQLKAKLEALQKSDCQNLDSKCALEFVCLTTDLKLYNQLYLHLQSQSDALINFSLGQKEKDEIECSLQGLASLLGVTKKKLDSLTFSSSTKINKQLRDLIVWAKQAENHISIGKKLALFPEEARIQIVEMKKFQTDILSRQSKMRVQVEEMKELASNMENEETDQVLKIVEDLYEAIADSLDLVLDTMRKDLQEREKLLCALGSMDAWLAETYAKRDPCTHVESVSKADLRKLESDLKRHELATVEIDSQLKLVEEMSESCRKIAIGLSPAESRYLVNRLSGLWTELDGLLAHEKATSWELEELIHEHTSSDQELSTIQASLKQISADLEQLKFPLTQETISVIAQWKHMLMEHQCQVHELQHCLEAKRSSLLCCIGELQDRFKALSINAFEQEKYLNLRTQMEDSRDIVKGQIQDAKNKAVSVDERFRLCQTVLVELPLVKAQCQEAADQLEVIAQELYPSVLNSERERIHHTVETLLSWEHPVTDDIKNLEAELLLGLQFNSELPACVEHLESTRVELVGAKPINPDEAAIDIALQQYWVIWRNMESGMRVLENLGQKEKIDLRNYKELYSLRDLAMQECHSQMVILSQARESLKDYHWAAQGAIGFLHNAEATFLSAPGGFLDCAEEQRQTKEALEALEEGFQAHICHLVGRVPQQPCLSHLKTEQLHINILSQLLVGRAILEAQAQIRLESLQRCELTQQSHKKCHEDIRQHLLQFEDKLSQCAAEHVTSYDKCVAQQRRAQLLIEDLHSLAGRIDDLRAGCPMQGCGVGKDGEVGALWRRWVSLRRGVGLLMAHTEQKGEEWKDIITSMEKCCSILASLQTEVRDSTTVNFTREEPQEILALAEMHQVGLEQEQQALASLEYRLEHALSLSSSRDFDTLGPIGKMLVKIQDNIRSLKEQNLLVVAAAQAEENERQQVQEQIEEIQKHVFGILPALEACLNPSERQELRKELSSQKTKLKCITDSVQSRYTEAPAYTGKQLQDLQMSLQRAEEKLIENSLVKKLASRVLELGSGMEKVKALLEQRSPTVSEAQNVLKHVWDELDAWHSSLMLLESEVQDLAEEQPDEAQLLIDQLTQPQQLYQDAAQMVEQRTTFLSKIPKCLQELEDILHSATRWLDEAQSWLSAPCSFTTAKSLQNHAKSLQLVLDDSEMIRHNLQAFRSVLAEISAVCDISTQEERLEQNDQQVLKMQGSILEPLEQLLQAVAMVERLEAELKTVEKNVPKIRTILSSIDDSNITLTEHLHNRQVILANVRSMRKTLEDIERCKGELHIQLGTEEGLQVHSRARLLLQSLEELEHLTKEQASLLENKIREEEEASTILGITAVSQEIQQLDRSLQSYLVQGAFEVYNSEEEEDEDDKSCHSSSSDTLTSSIPEDPEETLKPSDVQGEGMAERKSLSDIKDLESLVHQSSSGDAEKPKLDANLGSKCVETEILTPDSKADFDKALSPESVTAQSLNTGTIPAAEGQFKVAVVDQHDSPKHEAFDADRHTKTPQAAAAVDGTRLIPSRPITPFTPFDLIDEEEDDPSLSTALNPDLDVFNRLKEQPEVSTRCLLEGSQQPQQFSEEPISLSGCKDVNLKGQRWSHLHSQISEKLTTLKKVKEERQSQICREDGGNGEKVPDELISTGSTCAVLQQIHESITVLRQTVSSTDGSHPGLKEEFYEAVQRVLLCLDSLTDFLLTHGSAGEDESHLRLLQHECVSAELWTLSKLMSKVESETGPTLSKEEPDAYSSLTCLQDCLHTAQLVLTSSHNQLIEDPGLKDPCQELSSNQLCLLDEFELGQSQIFPNLKDAPSLECVLGRHLRESPGEKAKLQHSSRFLLQGITRLLELGEECTRERKMSQVHSRSKLQAVLCRNKKLLQVLQSQMAFVQYLFQHEPEALKCQEDERVQLEVRAKSLQQQALEQEVASQRRLQEWTRWEDNCGRLGRVLDESEFFISRWEPEGDDDEELVQHRLDACQQTLVQLDDSNAALGVILDQVKVLQAEPLFAASANQVGGALELRWKNTYKLTVQEIQRCRNIQDTRVRFQTNFDSVSEWLAGANNHLKTLSGLVDTSDLNQECVQSSLIKLLDFSMEMEGMSLLKASVSKDAAQLLQLKEADCPGLRTQLTQLENSWNQLTSDMSKTQDQLQQCLLAAQPSVELLSDLEDWLKQVQSCMNQEKEKALKASSAAQVTKILQHIQAFKAAVANGQLLLDFLCQPGPQMADVQALRSERTMFAEKLGTLKLQWLHFQRELESQISGAEQIHSTCAERERSLQCLHVWIEQQKKQLNQWKQPTSQTLAHKALLEWEALQGGVKEVATALQELKITQVHEKKKDEHPCAFSNEAEGVSHACRDLSQQIEALRPVLQQVVEKWSCFHRDLRDVTLHTTRVRCAFEHQQAPIFSLKQAEGYVDFLQQLQEEAGKGEALWAALDKSCQSLVGSLHHGAAQALRDEVEGERKRWKNMVQEIKDENIKTGETLSLWQEYANLSDSCSAQLEHLLHEWEELSRSSLSPGQDTQGLVCSVKKLEDAAEELQSSMGDVLASSKPLIGRLEPLPANLIQSETRLLSRGILLLNKAMSGKKKCLQEDLEQLKLFHTQLEVLEKQTQNLQHKLKAGIHDTDSVKQVLQELSDLFPSLLDVREMSGYVNLNNQETERLHMLSREWVESMTHTDRELQAECQRSLSFQEKSRRLTQIREKLEQESVCRKNPGYSSLQEMLTVHQRLQADIIVGHQLLQGLLCDAVKSMEKETGEKRSELMAQVVCLKDGWFSSVGLACQNRTLTKEQLCQWRIYNRGSRRLRKLLRDVDSLLPPTGHFLCTLDQLQNCVNDYQCVAESLDLHSTVYTQTLKAGRHLCEMMTDSECQSRLQSELQTIEEAWKRTTSLLRERRDLVHTTVQMWSQCQEGIISIVSELDKMKLKQQTSERPDGSALIQETELSLQHLTTGLRELATMKTDLSQYVAASDSALLEQQLEQLHSQWEELCMKVSLRKQEIADRLNAWTIFNDKNKEFCDWLTHMENKVCHRGDLSIKEMVEKLKKDCMEEINLFSENKSHLKQLGEQLLLASDEAKQTQVHESLQEVNQRWHNLFHQIEARVKKLKETLVTMQQLDKNMSKLRSWLSRIEAELSRPITYSVCHEQEIQRRLAEQQELQRDIEQHTEGVASVLSLCDVLLRDEDAAGGTEVESDSLQETSRSLDQRWRTICAMALDRRLRIEETWTLWCKFLSDYSRFEDWLKIAERTAANPNSADVLFAVAKEELKKFEGFQRQVHEQLTQLELVNNQYCRLARENRTDRASQLKAMVHEGNRRWDTLHRRVAAILRRLKHFTSQREEFEGTRESLVVWLTDLDLQLTNVEHFSESDVHHKIQQLNSFQKEITLNTERIDGLIVFGEGLIQKSSPQDAANIEEELEELHSYCQEVFSRLVRFHQRLSQPPMITEEPEVSGTTFSLESSLELIGRPWLGRSLGSLPATPTHLLSSPLERSGRETPDSLPLEWDHTVDVGGSSSHEDDEEEEGHEEEAAYFSALSEVELTENQEEFIEASEAPLASSLVSGRSIRDSSRWQEPGETQFNTEGHTEATPTLTSTPLKPGYLRLMSQCSRSIESINRVSLILDDEEQPEEFGLTGLATSDKQSGVIERWELLQAQSRCSQQAGPEEPQQLRCDLDNITSWLENVIPQLDRLQESNPAASIEEMEAKAKELKEMQKMFTHYKSIMLSVNLRAGETPEAQEKLMSMNRDWSRACTGLQQWDTSLRKKLMQCQEFHESLHSLLLWLAHAESRRYAVDISHPDTTLTALQQHSNTLTALQKELRDRQTHQASLQALWSQLQPCCEDGAEESDEAREKLHVTGSKLKTLLKQVDKDLSTLQQHLDRESATAVQCQNVSQEAERSKKGSSTQREKRESSPPRSFFYRALRAAFPLHLLLLLLLLLPCLIPISESDSSCTVANNFAWSFYPMLHYTNGPPPT